MNCGWFGLEEVKRFFSAAIEAGDEPELAQEVVFLAPDVVQFLDESLEQECDPFVEVLGFRGAQQCLELLEDLLQALRHRLRVPEPVQVFLQAFGPVAV